MQQTPSTRDLAQPLLQDMTGNERVLRTWQERSLEPDMTILIYEISGWMSREAI